jgi:hypothetical protein
MLMDTIGTGIRFVKDANLDLVSISRYLKLPVSNGLVETPNRGMFIYNSNDNILYYADGTTWIPINSSVNPPTLIDNQTFILHFADHSIRLGFDMEGSPNTTTTLQTSQSTNKTIITPDINGTIIVSQTGAPITNTGSGMVFINSPTNAALHQSSSGIQYSTAAPLSGSAPGATVSAQLRVNQYGTNANVPGVSTFKSRGTTIGSLAPVIVGDIIFGATAVGVTSNNSIPIGGLIQIVASSVPPASGWIGTDYVLSLVSKNGPANGRRKVFRVDSEGVLHLYEGGVVQGSPQPGVAGVVSLGVAGTFTVNNVNVSATSRITLTMQDGGSVPTGAVYVASRVPGVSFTIGSTTGAGNSGVNVYYQIYEISDPITFFDGPADFEY